MRAICLGIAAATALATAANAAPPMTKRVLSLQEATRVIEAGKAEAARNGWPAVIAVVDDGGWLIALQRMDQAPMIASVELAPQKARSAALFRKPTVALEKALNGGRAAAATAGFVMMQGGVPLSLDGQVVGAVGVSADTPDHDQIIADAAAKALTP